MEQREALQNQEYLVDSLYYVYFQNPYVLDLDISNCSYSDKNQMLYLEYEFDDETFDLWMKFHLATCERMDLIGGTNHSLDILKKL